MRSLGVLLFTLAAAPTSSCRVGDRITLTLENVGRSQLDSVVVLTTGRSYPVGSLPAGASRRLLIGADGESHIEVEHGIQSRQRLVVGTYLESGYGGRITVRLTADSVMAISDSIRI
jgi:hypothetical protein